MKLTSPMIAAAAAFMLSGLAGPTAIAASPGALVVTSPDGRSSITIERDASRFSVARRGESVIAASPLGLDLDGVPAFGPLALERRHDTSVDQVIALVATKADRARDHYRGATLIFRERAPEGRRLSIDVRAYDDGVAFRYRVDGDAAVRLRGERTAFVPAGDPECLVTPVQGSHEEPFAPIGVAAARRHRIRRADGVRHAFRENGVRHHPGPSRRLRRRGAAARGRRVADPLVGAAQAAGAGIRVQGGAVDGLARGHDG